MEFKHKDIEVVDEDNIIVWVKEHKVPFNLKKGQLQKDLIGMGVVDSDEAFEAYIVRAAAEWINKDLHIENKTKWIYDKSGGTDIGI